LNRVTAVPGGMPVKRKANRGLLTIAAPLTLVVPALPHAAARVRSVPPTPTASTRCAPTPWVTVRLGGSGPVDTVRLRRHTSRP
jgi:hypothetical protein